MSCDVTVTLRSSLNSLRTAASVTAASSDEAPVVVEHDVASAKVETSMSVMVMSGRFE